MAPYEGYGGHGVAELLVSRRVDTEDWASLSQHEAVRFEGLRDGHLTSFFKGKIDVPAGSKLRRLALNNHCYVDHINPILGLGNLEHLSVPGIILFRNINILRGNTTLKSLHIFGFIGINVKKVEELAEVLPHTRIRRLHFSHMPEKEIEPSFYLRTELHLLEAAVRDTPTLMEIKTSHPDMLPPQVKEALDRNRCANVWRAHYFRARQSYLEDTLAERTEGERGLMELPKAAFAIATQFVQRGVSDVPEWTASLDLSKWAK